MSKLTDAIEFTQKNIDMCQKFENMPINKRNRRKFETDIHKTILKALEEKQQQKWIPVSERLPEETGWYLVQYPKDCPTKGMSVTYFYKGDDKFQGIHDNIDAWRPLPEPYKEGKE